MGSYTDVAIKLALGILCLIIQINLMGKGNLAPTSAMDQVQNYVLGGIIGGVIYNESITVFQFFLVLVIWTLLVLVLKYLKEHNRYIKEFIDGKPIVLVQNGQILVNECMQIGISANDLMFKLRSAGVYEIKKVKKAIQEQNGQISVIQYGEESIKFPIITNGQMSEDVLDAVGKDEDWLLEQLSEQNVELSSVYVGEYVNGKIIVYLYEED